MSYSRESRGVVILGSTGSIGCSTLDVITGLPDRFHVVALSAARNGSLLQKQVDAFQPRFAHLAVGQEGLQRVQVITEPDPLVTLATLDDADIVVVATSGHAAILPTIRALEAGKVVALANKETIVSAGELVMPLARGAAPGQLRPVDSEHSAIWQCLNADRVDPRRVQRLVLTASGGPFRGWTRDQMRAVRPEDALRHPTWHMGTKVTIDSATMMNKGLELIEAHWLFDCPFDMIDIVVHPQSIVHSLVEFHDGALIAQLGSHDMRLPIQYALTYPERPPGNALRLDLLVLGRLDFEAPDLTNFPLVGLARDAGVRGQTYPTVLSTADEVAVQAFAEGHIPFLGIADVVEAALAHHSPTSGVLTLEAINEADTWARRFAERRIASASVS
jgi:1-deoxy-D-xylulose-5-phosphate reductoisomerase